MIITVLLIALGVFVGNLFTTTLNVILLYINLKRRQRRMSDIDALLKQYDAAAHFNPEDASPKEPSVN